MAAKKKKPTHGGKRAGAGRPPSAETPRDNAIAVRLTGAEYATVTIAAVASKQNLSTFTREAVVAASNVVARATGSS